VHVPTFLAQEWGDVFDRYLGFDWSQNACDVAFWRNVHAIPDHLFWSVRQSLKARMLHLVRQRVSTQHFRNNGSEAQLDRLLRLTDPGNPNVLTIGFARRFATYKRAALLLENLGWLKSIVCDEQHPVLFLFAGKAHPADVPGQDLIRRLTQISRMPEFEGRMLVVENYDLRLARRLVSGVDVWLNNPVYPLEASGTSGMKAALNGALNLSILDGWWDEWFDGQNGWAIATADGVSDTDLRDQLEAAALYDLIEKSVAPAFYEIDHDGLPRRWIEMMRHTLRTLGPKVLASRMVKEYVERLYVPATTSARAMAADGFGPARELTAWKARVQAAWPSLRVEHVEVEGLGDAVTLGSQITVRAYVRLGELGPADVKVQLVHGRVDPDDRFEGADRVPMEAVGEAGNSLWQYRKDLTLDCSGPFGYSVRIVPSNPGLASVDEMGLQVVPEPHASHEAGEADVGDDRSGS